MQHDNTITEEIIRKTLDSRELLFAIGLGALASYIVEKKYEKKHPVMAFTELLLCFTVSGFASLMMFYAGSAVTTDEHILVFICGMAAFAAPETLRMLLVQYKNRLERIGRPDSHEIKCPYDQAKTQKK